MVEDNKDLNTVTEIVQQEGRISGRGKLRATVFKTTLTQHDLQSLEVSREIRLERALKKCLEAMDDIETVSTREWHVAADEARELLK